METIVRWLAGLVPQWLLLRLLLAQLLDREGKSVVERAVHEVAQAHHGADTLALPAVEWRRDEAVRRARRRLQGRDSTINLACELTYWIKR